MLNINNLNGFGVVNQLTDAYIGRYSIGSTAANTTYTDIDIGSPAQDRIVLVFAYANRNGDITLGTPPCVIGGVTATTIVTSRRNGTTDQICTVFGANVPNGRTVDIAMSYSAAPDQGQSIGVAVLYTTAGAVNVFDTVSIDAFNTITFSTNIDTAANGVLVGVVRAGNSTAWGGTLGINAEDIKAPNEGDALGATIILRIVTSSATGATFTSSETSAYTIALATLSR